MMLVMAIVVIVIFGAGATYAVIQYFTIARTLPDISGLSERASQFETTRILDRNGNVLYEILDPNAGRRTYVPLERISPYLIAATIATEDKEYYNHPGFDPIAIARAFWQTTPPARSSPALRRSPSSWRACCCSTPKKPAQRTYERKAREIVLAAELTRRYSKDDILELFLNENNYGNLAYGIEAAAETYFNTSAEQLNLAQAAFLAGLPQAPAVHDIYSNRDETLRRHKQVLVLMYQLSQEKNCIEVSNSIQPVCVDAQCCHPGSPGNRSLQFPAAAHLLPLPALGKLHPHSAGSAVRRADDLPLRLHRHHHPGSRAAGPGPEHCAGDRSTAWRDRTCRTARWWR